MENEKKHNVPERIGDHLKLGTHNASNHTSCLANGDARRTSYICTCKQRYDSISEKNLYQVALLSTFYKGDHGGLIIQ